MPDPNTRRPAALRPAFAAALALVLSFPGVAARANDPQLLGSFREWNAFALQERKQKVCYMASRPTRQEGDFTKRGDVHALITHRPAERAFDVVSVFAGYTYQPGSEVVVQIGNQTFRLFTDGDTAWARDEATDRALSNAIRQGSTMVVRGTSARGTKTVDTYSLGGSGAAYQAINKACEVTGR